jgi:hypothetical protein
VTALETVGKGPVTKEKAGAICLEDLLSECSAVQIASTPELFAGASERISRLEPPISSYPLAVIAELKESIKRLCSRISTLEPNLPNAQTDLKELK